MQLQARYKNNKRSRFQKAQTKQFIKLLDGIYSKVLDVGCGKGYWSYVGARFNRFEECNGCDEYDDWQQEELSKYCQKAEYRTMKNGKLPYRAKQFELVFSMDVIEHMKDDISFIQEHFRVCKTGGTIIIGTPNYYRITNILLLVLGKLKYPRNMGPDTYGDCIHLREYKMHELVKKIVESSGGRVKAESVDVFPCWIGVLMLSFGIEKFPKCLNNLCQFFFIKVIKSW